MLLLTSTITQNICKSFPEAVIMLNKRVSVTQKKIQPQVDKLATTRKAYEKLLEKYNKLCSDVLVSIKSKEDALAADAAAAAAAAGGGASGGGGGIGGGGDDAASRGGFMDRSINKIMATISPLESKRHHERCVELLKEMTSTEQKLYVKAHQMNEQQLLLEEEVSHAMAELDDVEITRLAVMREGVCVCVFILFSTCVCVSSSNINNLFTHTHTRSDSSAHWRGFNAASYQRAYKCAGRAGRRMRFRKRHFDARVRNRSTHGHA